MWPCVFVPVTHTPYLPTSVCKLSIWKPVVTPFPEEANLIPLWYPSVKMRPIMGLSARSKTIGSTFCWVYFSTSVSADQNGHRWTWSR